jgi:hypothetical protein
MKTKILSLEEAVRLLSTLTTRDSAGRHFTVLHPSAHLDDLEQAGYIEVYRPAPFKGIPWAEYGWHVEVTDSGRDLVEFNPEYWPEEAQA